MIADILVLDAEGRPLLVGEVKTRSMTPNLVAKYADYLKEADPAIRFGLLVDFDKIYIYDFQGSEYHEPVCSLNTADILLRYEPDFGKKRIFHFYLSSLVERWLRDLTLDRNPEATPGEACLRDVGLLPLLEGGALRSEVPLGVDALR